MSTRSVLCVTALVMLAMIGSPTMASGLCPISNLKQWYKREIHSSAALRGFTALPGNANSVASGALGWRNENVAGGLAPIAGHYFPGYDRTHPVTSYFHRIAAICRAKGGRFQGRNDGHYVDNQGTTVTTISSTNSWAEEEMYTRCILPRGILYFHFGYESVMKPDKVYGLRSTLFTNRGSLIIVAYSPDRNALKKAWQKITDAIAVSEATACANHGGGNICVPPSGNNNVLSHTPLRPETRAELAELERRAQKGGSKAMDQLGRIDLKRKDYRQSLYWFRRSAMQDNADAEDNLGRAYWLGEGVKEDDHQAAIWFLKSAPQGNVDAESTLGLVYLFGLGNLPRDFHRALFWSRKAAAHGDAAAENNIGLQYHMGEGVPKNDHTAFGWYCKAAKQGNRESEQAVGMIYANGTGVRQSYHMAFNWFRRSAAQGDAHAEDDLGQMYEDGLGVPRDLHEALTWYRKAAAQGDAYAIKAVKRLSHAGS